MLVGWQNGEKIAVVLLGTAKQTGKALPDTPTFCWVFFRQMTGEFNDQITSFKITELGHGIEQPHCLSLESFL